MKINQIIINELSEGAQPGVATTTAQTPQAQAAAQAIQKGLEKLQQQSPGLDHSFNTTTAIQEILPDGTVVMDSNLQPSALQNVRKILALGGGANFKVSMSYQGIPSAASMSTAQPQPGVAEGHRPFRGVGGAFNRGDDERHDLDPTDWYIVKDGKMLVDQFILDKCSKQSHKDSVVPEPKLNHELIPKVWRKQAMPTVVAVVPTSKITLQQSPAVCNHYPRG